MKKETYMLPNPMTPCIPITFDEDLCVGCNTCVNVCRTDVLMPNPTMGGVPIVLYPDECWFCGCCVEDCPVPGASQFHQPLNQQLAWKRKDTGELFRVGGTGNPEPSVKGDAYI